MEGSSPFYDQEFLAAIREKLEGEIEECQKWINDHPNNPPMDKKESEQYVQNCHEVFNHDSMTMRRDDALEAIARIEKGTFGICIGYGSYACGAKIPEERLMACPTAKRCAKCQQIYEKKYGRKYY